MNQEIIKAIYRNGKKMIRTFKNKDIYTVLDWMMDIKKEKIEFVDIVDIALNILFKKFGLLYVSELNGEGINGTVKVYLDTLIVGDKWLEVHQYILGYVDSGGK